VAEATLLVIRRILLGILLIGLVGMGTELLFLQHDEGATQLIPLVLIALALVTIAWHAAQGGRASLGMIQVTMVLFIAAGPLGMYLHYRANVAFQREVDPSITGQALFWKAVTAKTPPALAPGSMSQLGLIGLAYAYASGYPFRQRRPDKPLAPGTGRAEERVT
jgi:hypothetical protein